MRLSPYLGRWVHGGYDVKASGRWGSQMDLPDLRGVLDVGLHG